MFFFTADGEGSAEIGRRRNVVVSCVQGIPHPVCSLLDPVWLARSTIKSFTSSVSIKSIRDQPHVQFYTSDKLNKLFVHCKATE